MPLDTEKLIREIESRKAIWDVSCEEYRDREVKRRRWEEVTNTMCEDNNMTENEKREFCTSLQLKWKNIRTSFSRELKRIAGATSGSAASRKSPYVYFQQLKFLKENLENNSTQASMDESDVGEYNDSGGWDKIRSPAKRKKQKTANENSMESSKQSMAMSEKCERNQARLEEDPDKFFMLSLLDDFKKIPEHLRLSTKIELIEVLQRAQNQDFDYMQGTSTALPHSRRYAPEASWHYPQGYAHSVQLNYGAEGSIRGKFPPEYSSPLYHGRGDSSREPFGSRRGHSTSVPERRASI